MPASGLQPDQLRVRMYRVGFGDCFLLSLPEQGGHRHILIDCGVHAKGDIQTMPRVVQDVRTETADKLDVVVVSHAHQDHISGFGTHAQAWSNVTVNEIWMPWTEDPADAQAVELRTRQLSLAQQLLDHLTATRQLNSSTDSILENFVGFHLAKNADSMRVARGGFRGPQKIRYLEAGDKLNKAAGIAGLEAVVMSPSRDEAALKRMNPPAGQRWLSASGASDGTDVIAPFPAARCTRTALKRRGRTCVLDEKEERQLRDYVLADDSLALMLDDVLNNTSLVLLLRFHGSALLFPGDAQWGNWSTWLLQNGADAILNEITFFKVGHHGSHNSTPSTVVPKLDHPDVAAMISTQNRPFKSIPKRKMVDALTTQCRKRIARSDWVRIPAAPNQTGPKKLARPFKRGPFWIDYLRIL